MAKFPSNSLVFETLGKVADVVDIQANVLVKACAEPEIRTLPPTIQSPAVRLIEVKLVAVLVEIETALATGIH